MNSCVPRTYDNEIVPLPKTAGTVRFNHESGPPRWSVYIVCTTPAVFVQQGSFLFRVCDKDSPSPGAEPE